MEPPAPVVDYDPAWPSAFEEVRGRVGPAVADLALAVEHVGSTAVPGLAGKPIIDVDVVLPDVSHDSIAIERLAALGYEHQGDLGVAGREAFKPPPGVPYHHLYVVAEGSKPHRVHIDLRNYLRQHLGEARRYAERKREIARLLTTDREAYTRGKATSSRTCSLAPVARCIAHARRPDDAPRENRFRRVG